MTEVIRNKNAPTNTKIASSLVKETMNDYLSNLSNLVIDSVNKSIQSSEEDDTETSIQETVTVEPKNGLFTILET